MFLGWLLPAMLNNIMLCFTALLPPDTLTALKKTRHCATLGFSRWFQQMAGEALVEVGVRLAKDELGDVELRTELWAALQVEVASLSGEQPIHFPHSAYTNHWRFI